MTIQRGEIWVVRLDPTLGDEIRKTRPAIVVSNDALGVLALRAVVPITAWQVQFAHMDWFVHIATSTQNGLEKASAADTFQIRSISTKRFVRRIGELEVALMDQVSAAIKVALDLG